MTIYSSRSYGSRDNEKDSGFTRYASAYLGGDGEVAPISPGADLSSVYTKNLLDAPGANKEAGMAMLPSALEAYGRALAFKKSQEENGGIGGAIGGAIGSIAGSFLGPVGGIAGGKIGSMLGGLFG